jgi:mycoredoxin
MLNVYAAGWCPHCTRTIEYLKKNAIEFKYVEIEQQPQDVIKKIIQVNGGDDWVVPTLEFNGKWRLLRQLYFEQMIYIRCWGTGGTPGFEANRYDKGTGKSEAFCEQMKEQGKSAGLGSKAWAIR